MQSVSKISSRNEPLKKKEEKKNVLASRILGYVRMIGAKTESVEQKKNYKFIIFENKQTKIIFVTFVEIERFIIFANT